MRFVLSACGVSLAIALLTATAPARAEGAATTQPAKPLKLRLEITNTLAESAAFPVALVLRITNDGDQDVENESLFYCGFFDDSAFDFQFLQDGHRGGWEAIPLGPKRQAFEFSGLVIPWVLRPGESREFRTTPGKMPAGRFRVRVVNRPPDPPPGAESYIRLRAAPMKSVEASLEVSENPRTAAAWVERACAALDREDRFYAKLGGEFEIEPMRQHMLRLLSDPTRVEAGFAARNAGYYAKGANAAEFAEALRSGLLALDAMPAERRNREVTSDFLQLLQSRPQPELLDLLIRWSRPNGSEHRGDVLMTLQAYRDDPRGYEAVASLVNDDTWSIALEAAEFIQEWRHDVRAIPTLEKHAFMTDGPTSQPNVYFGRLATYGRNPSVLAAVKRGMDDPRAAVRNGARGVARSLGLDPTTKPAP